VKDAESLRFVQVNAAGLELLGYSEEEMLGKNDHDFFPKEQADFFATKDLFNEVCRIASQDAAFPLAWIAVRNPVNGELEAIAWTGIADRFFTELRTTQPTRTFSARAVGNRAINERCTIVDNDIDAEPDLDAVRREAVGRGCRSVIALPLYAEGSPVGSIMLYSLEQYFFDAEEVKLLEELAGDVSFALTFIAQQKKVEYLAFYDTLTALPNRTLFFDRLARQLAAAARNQESVVLILIDLDRFRLINDTLGRHAGDELLVAVAKRLMKGVRQEDAIGRVASNRFAIAVTAVWSAAGGAHALEARSRACFNQPFTIGQEELRVSAAAGVALFPADANSAEALFANAEAALRSAKTENLSFQFYGPAVNARVAESLRMENRLQRALANDELALWYQPKVCLETGRPKGFEALMRWQDPESGLVLPGHFIPLMEQTGLIVAAGEWALSRVSEDCRPWRSGDTEPLRIAVNVSSLQLRQKAFVKTVIDAAAKIEKAGSMLDLEITETVIMQNIEAIIPKLQTIRGLGVEIFVDDFGTGYSSLTYIARLPIYALKVDRSFVVGMTENEDSLAIVRSVISLAHSLRLGVIAEGVETEQQAALLSELDCDEIQGYLVSRPMPPEQVMAFIADRGRHARVFGATGAGTGGTSPGSSEP